MRKSEIKEVIKEACVEKFGFAPKKKEIILLEAATKGDMLEYVSFRVGKKEYCYELGEIMPVIY